MRIQFVNPFLDSASAILEQVAGVRSKRGDLALRESTAPEFEVAVILGIVGQIRGQVIYELGLETAMKLASNMMGGIAVEKLDEMAKSAISEFGNMVTGNTSMLLEKQGINCDISPPTMVVGKNLEVSAVKVQTLVIPLETDIGILQICVGIQGD